MKAKFFYEGKALANGKPSGAPTVSTAEVILLKDNAYFLNRRGRASIAVESRSATGAASCKIRLWGYLNLHGVWFPIGPGDASLGATKGSTGLLNAGDSIKNVDGGNNVAYVEDVQNLWDFDALYAELLSPAGADAVWDVSMQSRGG